MGDDTLDLEGLNEHERRNRADWNADAPKWVAPGQANWATDAPHWGAWHVPEADVGILPADADLDGKDVVELGCGTAYWSAWLARKGMRPVGVDLSEAQLATARTLQAEHGLTFPLIHASAERVPLPDAGFDLAFSEYGAAIWCDPYAWIPEAHRLLRPGGRLIFLANSVIAMLTMPLEGSCGPTLLRDQFGLYRLEWEGEEGVDFHLPHGEMLALLRDTGFEVEALHELRAPDGDPDDVRFFVGREWSRRWPSEEVWVARKRDA
jgi:SAM-dependent methyltransferase